MSVYRGEDIGTRRMAEDVEASLNSVLRGTYIRFIRLSYRTKDLKDQTTKSQNSIKR